MSAFHGSRFIAAAWLIAVVAAGSDAVAQQAPASTCEPSCRSGFICLEGQCVSACNPPCAVGQVCAANGECAPAPAGYPPAAAAPGGYPAPPGYAPAYPPAAYAPWAPPPPPPPVGVHLHDGFFLRLGTGFAYTSLHFSDEVAGDTDVSGGGLAIDVTIGGAIRPGVILAGSMYGGSYPDPTVKYADGSSATASKRTLNVFGGAFLVDYYPDPSGGFHFGGDFGIGGASLQNRETGMTSDSDHDPIGVSTAAHVGYELWISDQWSVGGLFKLSYVNLKRAASSTPTATYSAFSVSGFQPLFVAAFTFN